MSRGCYDAGTGKEVWKMNDYDERQILARGRAFMWGFFTLMLCLMAYGFTDMLIEPWCDTLTGCIICIPGFPDGCCAMIHLIQPGRPFLLPQDLMGGFCFSQITQHIQDKGSSQKSGANAPAAFFKQT